jgi:hypothetical protein
MRKAAGAIALLAGLIPLSASAQVQGVDLNGRYLCIAVCRGIPGNFAFITQYGTELNVVNDAGFPSRAWVDYPGHIWLDRANEGAVYSPDGIRVQFDSGTVWQRAPLLPPPPSPPVILRRRG